MQQNNRLHLITRVQTWSMVWSLQLPSSCASFRKAYKLLIWWKTRDCTWTVQIRVTRFGFTAFSRQLCRAQFAPDRLRADCQSAHRSRLCCASMSHATERAWGLLRAPHRLLLLKALPSLHWSTSANKFSTGTFRSLHCAFLFVPSYLDHQTTVSSAYSH